MSRIRSIKPELLEDERIASLPHGVFRLFVAVLLLADDYGNFRAEPRQLFGRGFVSVDKCTPADVQTFRDQLATSGLLFLYRVRGQTYGHVVNWDKHQYIARKGAPRVPAPDAPDAEPMFANVSGLLTDSSELLVENPTNSENVGLRARAPDLDLDQEKDQEQTNVEKPPRPSGGSGSVDPGVSPQVREVFEHWVETRRRVLGLRDGRPPTLDRKRRGKVRARLADGYSVAQLKRAVDGVFCSAFHVEGAHTDLELICRDSTHVDRFLALDEEARRASGLPMPEDAPAGRIGAARGHPEGECPPAPDGEAEVMSFDEYRRRAGA